MKKITALILCFLLANNVFATAIVIYITPEFVIMAADSRVSFTNVKTKQQQFETVSKIYKSGDTYFSIAGIVSNNLQAYNASSIINKELKNGDDIKTSINRIKINLKKALLKYLEQQKKSNYTLFKKNIAKDYFITSVGIINILNNKPYAHIIGFKVQDGKELKINIDEVHYDGSNKEDAIYYLGKSDEINRYMNTVENVKTEPGIFVEELITKQAKKTPLDVALPVDIIKLTATKTIWIKKQKSTPVIIK